METISFMDKCQGIGHVLTRFALILGVVLFGTAAILFSTAPAQADAPQTSYATGKYGMSLSTIVENGKTMWYVLIWDTETGRSKFYYGNGKEGTQPALSRFNLPSSPL